jgi:hypothetical protein
MSVCDARWRSAIELTLHPYFAGREHFHREAIRQTMDGDRSRRPAAAEPQRNHPGQRPPSRQAKGAVGVWFPNTDRASYSASLDDDE